MSGIKIIRATTVPMSLEAFCNGMLKELSRKYEVIALSSPGEEMKTVAEREGVRTIEVPMERHIAIWKDFVALCKLICVFLRERPTMVHSMTPKAGLLCMMAAWITRVPVRVHTFTGLVFPTAKGFTRRILMATDWLTCACATHIIPEGEGVKNDLLKNGITKKPLKVLGYGNVRGVDMNKYSVESLELRVNSLSADDKGRLKAMMKKSPKFTFLFVGRIVRDKGIDELCAAFDKLSGLTEARLVLVGPYEDSLDPISEKSREIVKKNPDIECVGPKMGDELLAYYAAADCFVFPSYREGFPNTVLEAGAMGLPSIVTDINGSREIIIPRRNGVIIPPRDASALFQAMLDMMRDRTARECMAANTRQMISSRYEQSYVRQCLYDFYDEILS